MGRLVILIDGGCASACEDFVMPFKDSHRATLIGETTYGSYSDTYFLTFDNGMMLNTAVTRVSFPDGNRFESVGISPDIRIERTVEDVRSGNDRAMTRALEVLRSPNE
ncbi:MAG: S41 family peptidase [Terriglobales bacterium]